MSDISKIELMSRDVEFVKDTVQDISRRVNSLETTLSKHSENFTEHVTTDKQMYEEIKRTNDILEKNTESLIEHVRRTELNEIAIQELKSMNQRFDSRLTPIEHSHIEKAGLQKLWVRVGVALGIGASAASIIYNILQIIGVL